MHKPKRTEGVEFIYNYFNHNPQASTSDCARVASASRIPVSMDLIATIRMKMRQDGLLGSNVVNNKKQNIPIPPKLFNPVIPAGLKIVQKAPTPTPAPPKMAELMPEPKLVPGFQIAAEIKAEERASAPKILLGEELKQAKIKYLNEMLDEEPGLRVNVVQDRLKERYGGSLSPFYILEVLKLAREAHGLSNEPKATVTKKKEPKKREPKRIEVKPTMAKPVVPPKTKAPESQIVATSSRPNTDERRFLTWKDADKKTLQWEIVKLQDAKARVMRLIVSGVDVSTIEVWENSHFKISIDIG